MLKYRLVFGTLMTALFAALIIFDGWLDGTLTASTADDKQVQGTVFCVLLALLVIPTQLELSKLAEVKNLKIFLPITIITSILFVTAWYWPQLVKISPALYLTFVSAFSLLGLFLYQYFRCGTSEVMANCGISCFSIIYLGLLGSFALGIRIDFGPLALLMYIFVIKSADIGAYSIGSIFGRHKFSPVISPGKSWEGMAGAVAVAIIVAILFAVICDIMTWWSAAIFGLCFAFIGQLGDLAESMIKRDAQKKDSAGTVPGFGGLLDILDSLLPAAPLAYLFFMLCAL